VPRPAETCGFSPEIVGLFNPCRGYFHLHIVKYSESGYRGRSIFNVERSLDNHAQATLGLQPVIQGTSDRHAGNARHLLGDILANAILAVLCGTEGWSAVESWATLNFDFLASFLERPPGFPNHDTFDRVFATLGPHALGLDACMNEDQSRLRVKHVEENFLRLRRIVLNKLKRGHFRKTNGKSYHTGICRKQQACDWSHKAVPEELLV